VKGTVIEVSSAVVWFGIALMNGASFTGLMVTEIWRVVMLLDNAPSLAISVSSAVPLELAVGTKVNVPVWDGLVYCTVGCGMSSGLLEVTESVTVWALSLAAPTVMLVNGTV